MADGGFVAFRSETSGPGSAQTKDNPLASLLYSQAFAGENRVIHRVLTDADRRVVFAYDLAINSDPVTKKFSVSVLPADEAFRRSFLKRFCAVARTKVSQRFPNRPRRKHSTTATRSPPSCSSIASRA